MFVSVVTSVYNCQDYVGEMLDSILNQTFHNWECVVIDDASTDNTWDVIKRYKDDRIIAIQNERNEGLTKNLNKGIAKAKGKYIIRIDGDDIAYPTRFEKQISFMENNPQVVVSGSYMQCFGQKYNISKAVLSDDKLRVNMLFNSVIYHPTFIIRKSVLDRFRIWYNEKFNYAQDYNLLYQLMQYGKLANIPEILVKRRIHEKQIASTKFEQQQECANATRRLMLKLLGIELGKEEQEYWFRWCINNGHNIMENESKIICKIHERILDRNKSADIFSHDILEKALKEKMKPTLSDYKEVESKKQDKYLTLFLMMNQWVKVKQAGKNVAVYLEREGYNKIAIYGMGYVGETLMTELKNTNIEVVYLIDKNAANIHSHINIVTPNDELKAVDAVVVTSVTFFDEVKENLNEKLYCPIISLIDILFDI